MNSLKAKSRKIRTPAGRTLAQGCEILYGKDAAAEPRTEAKAQEPFSAVCTRRLRPIAE